MWLNWQSKLRFLPGSCQFEAARHPNCASRINNTAVHLGHRFQHPRFNNASSESNNKRPPNMFFQSSRRVSIRVATSKPRLRVQKANSNTILCCTRIHSPTPLQLTPAFPAFLPQSGETLPPHPIQLAIGPNTSARRTASCHANPFIERRRRAQLANKLLAADRTGSCGKRRKEEEQEKQRYNPSLI